MDKLRRGQHIYEGFESTPTSTTLGNGEGWLPISALPPTSEDMGWSSKAIFRYIDKTPKIPTVTYYAASPMGLAQSNSTTVPTGQATSEQETALCNGLFDVMFNNNTWMPNNGYEGSSNVATLERKYGMTGNWKSDSDPLSAINTMILFLNDVTSSDTNLASYRDKNSGLFGNANKQGLDKAAQALGNDVKNVIQKLANDLGDVGLSELIPFKPRMQAAIKVAKYPDPNPPNDTLHLAQEFVKKVIQGEQFESYEKWRVHSYNRGDWDMDAYESHFEQAEASAADVKAGAAIGGVAGTVVPGVGNAIGAGVGALVAAIIDWFKKAHTAVTTNPAAATPAQQAAVGTPSGGDAISDAVESEFTNPDGSVNYTKVAGAGFIIIAIFVLIYFLVEYTD